MNTVGTMLARCIGVPFLLVGFVFRAVEEGFIDGYDAADELFMQ